MNELTSRQRKLVYLGGIVVLLIPIIWLGMPAGAATSGAGDGMVGRLAELRQQYELGEATLGNVDPSSATMNLVLLGLRGVAANVLWQNANEQQKTKEWAKMRATVSSIILLQPHFTRVWEFQAWNLAFNVSSVHDRVADRWYWVKEGGKFAILGTERNARSAFLYSQGPGRIVGFKIGRADEWQSYRAYYQRDPDTAMFNGGPDPGIASVDGELFTDNYRAARRWFEKANDAEERFPQPFLGGSRIYFRHQPARAEINSAVTLQREGRFGEETRERWNEAYRLWTEVFGREMFKTLHGEIMLNATPADIKRLAQQEQLSEEQKWQALRDARQTVNYEHWLQRCQLERRRETQETRKMLWDARRMFREEPGRLAPTLVRGTPAGARIVFGRALEHLPERVPGTLAGSLFKFAVAAINNQPLPQQELARAQVAAVRARLAEFADPSFSPEERAVLVTVLLSDRPVPRSQFVAASQISDDTLARLEERAVLETVSEVQVNLEAAMAQYERLLPLFPLIAEDREAVEEGLLAVLYWQKLYQLYNRPVPTHGYPLEAVWNQWSNVFLEDAQRKFMDELEFRRR